MYSAVVEFVRVASKEGYGSKSSVSLFLLDQVGMYVITIKP
jgi:hypothetical protein